jgi:electron transfer flavoprotein beta subunit
MPALQKAKAASSPPTACATSPSSLPKQQRTTRVVKDMSPDEIANELVEWIGAE